MRNKLYLFAFIYLLLLNTVNSLFAQNNSIKKSHFQVLPVVARSIETNWAFGSAGSLTFHPDAKDTISRTSNLIFLGLYSVNKQFISAINGTQYFNKEKFILNEQISYSSFPNKYWGLGNFTADNNEESYDFKQFYVYLHPLYKIAPHLFLGNMFEFQKVWDVSYNKGGMLDQDKVVGRKGYQVSGLGGSITYDNRNDAFYPDKGAFAQIYFNHFNPIFGSDYQFTSFELDVRKFYRLVKHNILALQVYSFNNVGSEIPLRSLAYLGGASKLRGYYEGRYLDNNNFVIQSEYRFKLYKRFSMVSFFGLGTLTDKIANYSINALKYSYGIGARFALNKSEKLNIRLDYGIGSGINNGFNLQLGEAF
jgi:hypothetical protein